MSSPSPRRRHSPAVYRRRRLFVALLAVLLVAGVVAVVAWQPWRSWADVETAPTSSPGAPTASPSADGTGTPMPTSPAPVDPAPEASASAPSPEDDDAEIVPCTTADVTVAAIVDKSSYGTGEMPQMSIRLTNDTDVACLINVGTTAQTFEIMSGSDVWWRSTDCQSAPSDQVVQLDAGQTVTSATPLIWDRTRSSVDSCEGERQSALPGWYNLTVTIGGIESVEPAQFTLR